MLGSRWHQRLFSDPIATLSIQERLTWAMVLLITITVLVASWVTVRNATEQEDQKLFAQASHDLGLVAASFDGSVRLLQAQAALIASSPAVHTAVAARDRQGLLAFLGPRASIFGDHSIVIVAADGTALLNLGSQASGAGAVPTLHAALAGSSTVAIERDRASSPASAWTLRAATPITEHGHIVGALAMGEQIDAAFAGQLARYAGNDASVSITSGRLVVASSQKSSTGSIAGQLLPASIVEGLSGGSTGSGSRVLRTNLFGLDAVYAIEPYLGTNHQPAGYIVVAEPLTLARAVVSASLPRIAQAFLGVLLLGLLVSWLVGRTISRPIRRLSRAAARLARGELQVPIYAEGNDEVAALARVMEGMRLGLSLLLEGSRTIAASLDQEEVLTTLCGLVDKALGGNRAFVFLLGPDGKTIEGASAEGVEIEQFRRTILPACGDALLTGAIEQAQPVVIADRPAGDLASPLMERYGLRSALALPLVLGDRVAGVLIVGHTILAQRFTGDHVPLAGAFAQQATVAMEHARLYRDARDASRYLESVISTTPDAIATLDAEGCFEYVNEPTCTQLGYSRPELLHEHFSICFPASEQESVRAEWERLRDSGSVEFTTTLRRKDGELRTTFVKLATIATGQRYVAIARDVTEGERLLAEIQQRNKELDTLYQVADTVSASLDVAGVLQQALTLVLETMHAEAGRIYLLERGAHELDLAAQIGAVDRLAQGMGKVHLGERLTGLVAEQRIPLVVDDIQQDWRASREAKDEGIRSYAGIPLITKQEVVGVMSVESYRVRPFLPREVDLLLAIGHEIAVAIENGRLYERARELAVSEERNRLAREIHDTLAQGLTGITLQLELAKTLLKDEPAAAEEPIQKSLALARSNLEEARRSVLDLRAAPLQELALPQALERLCDQVGRDTGLDIAIQRFGEGRMGRLPSRVEAGLYRVAQEALTNVTRHADATHVDVLLNYDGAELHLVVQDDGKGFDPAMRHRDDRGGFGLVGVQERARLLGGIAEISSAPGMGTRVEVTVPDSWSRYVRRPDGQEVVVGRA